MEQTRKKLEKIVKISAKDFELVQATPAWKTCGDMLVIHDKLEENCLHKDAKFLRQRIKYIINQFIDHNNDNKEVSLGDDKEFDKIVEKAKELGWSEEELIGTSDKHATMSLAQLFIAGSKPIKIDNRLIKLKTPLGAVQNVWRHERYR